MDDGNTNTERKRGLVRSSGDSGQPPMSIVAFNVNGMRPCVWNWIQSALLAPQNKPSADILFLSETKTDADTLKRQYFTSDVTAQYDCLINSHSPPSRHGVAMLIRKGIEFKRLPFEMDGCPVRADAAVNGTRAATGRVIAVCIQGAFNLVGAYVPNAGRQGKHLLYRVQSWDPAFGREVRSLALPGAAAGDGSKSMPTLVIGDLNVAPEDVDVSHVTRMRSWAGCSREERANFASFLQAGSADANGRWRSGQVRPITDFFGSTESKKPRQQPQPNQQHSGDRWYDVWRKYHPATRAYSWSGSGSAQDAMRLDHAVASPDMLPFITECYLMPLKECIAAGSDHVPIGVRVRTACPVGR